MDAVSESGSLESLLESRPLPPVNAEDLKRVWELMQRVNAEHGSQRSRDRHRQAIYLAAV
jgi:hypothetical protein